MNAPGNCLLVNNQTRDTVLCSRAMLADTTLSRLFGLLGKPPLSPTQGLLIRPSSGVHTWGMTFAIDIVALGRDDLVVGVWRAIGPWRLCGVSFKTSSILELACGSIDKSGTAVGDKLQMTALDQ
jgi:uncharacterized membrane protein (UPF0127 family)